MKRMSYRPGVVRRVLIPKGDGGESKRPLGVSNFEDKIVQGMTDRILKAIYEPLFLDCSYGFRPGLGCHDAIRSLHHHLYRKRVETVIDIDLENFFGTLDHDLLLEMLREKISDKRFIRYLSRHLKAGVLSDGDLMMSEEGVPQGSLVSPVLANIFAHHVIDEWFEDVVKHHCAGEVALFRYCDDAVICCEYAKDAERIKRALTCRLSKYKLRLNEDKTQLVSFSKRGYRRGEKQQSFDFLGFTFYWGRAREGYPLVKVKTSGKRIRAKLTRINQWCRKVRCRYRLPEIWRMFCMKLQGHMAYYGVTFNSRHVQTFIHKATFILYKWLIRRSQRSSLDWEKFSRYRDANPLPKVRVIHKLY